MKTTIQQLPTARITPGKDQKVFIISDTHFDHTNIIQYCKRPFSSIEEMNNALVNNWNAIVKNEDLILILGDVVHGRNARSASYWLKQLNGEKILIRGNHDKGFITECSAVINHGAILDFENKEYLLVHHPGLIIPKENQWVIHGHVHNKHPDTFPLVNKENKTINVSVEMIEYTPIELSKVIALC